MNVGLNTRSITINKNDFDSQQYFREFHRSTRQKGERKAERERENTLKRMLQMKHIGK